MNSFPEPGALADVVLDGGWRQHVVVVQVADGVVLRPIDGLSILPGTLTWCPAALEWRDAGRAARVFGMVTASPDGFTLTTSTATQDVQRREFVRVPAEVRAAIVSEDLRIVARTINLSLGGALLTDAGDLRVGDPLRFALELGDGDAITVSGRVVRGDLDGTRGIAFDALDQHVERRLARFLADRQRSVVKVGAA